MKSPWTWQQHGQCGKWVSDLVPHLAELRRRHRVPPLHGREVERPRPGDVHAGHRLRAARLPEHGRVGQLRPGQPERQPARVRRPARLARLRPQRPGQLERRLPARQPPGDDDPRRRRRTRSTTCSRPRTAYITPRERARRPGTAADSSTASTSDPRRATRGSTPASHPTSWPPACSSAPRRCSTSPARPTATQQLYGLDEPITEDFGRNCLIARRLLERGVRFVQVWSGADNGFPRRNWDSHEDLARDHGDMGTSMDQPAAALIKDLKAPRPARRHDRHLDDRVRPDAVQPGEQGPRPQPVHLHHLARRRRHQGRRHLRRERRVVATRPSSTRPTATTSTPRCCTCSASTTPG